MTTIASDGKTVAADGLTTAGDEPLRSDRIKIKHSALGTILGFTGIAALQSIIFSWFEDGADPDKISGVLKEKDWSLVEFRETDVAVYHHDLPYPNFLPYPFSVGAGEDYALGALMAGATPERAVQIASEKNVKTGGNITVLSLSPMVLRDAAE